MTGSAHSHINEQIHNDIYSDDGAIRADFLDKLIYAVKFEDTDFLTHIIAKLHESEIGDILETLEPEDRSSLIHILGNSFNFEALTEVDNSVRANIIQDLTNEQIVEAVKALETDDAVYILEDLTKEKQTKILAEMPFAERIRLRRSLEYPEETAGRRMTSDYVAVPPFWSVGQTIDYLRDSKDLPDTFTQIFVIDPTFSVMGVINLDRILRTKRDVQIKDIMHETQHTIPAKMDQEEAAQIFEQYDLLSAAVIDDNQKLVGVLTIDDIVDVIQEETEEDFKKLAGVGDEDIYDKVLNITKSRFIWLLINLGTAVLASLVIGLFDATISEMVALAVLMPIVASMGGNAGTQTMTVAVRALATKDLDIYNASRIIRRELIVGFANGILFAIIIGIITLIWFSNIHLGFTIAIAMVINMICAALAGILIPLVLDRAGIDPATASSVFVTTITDVVGFFAFLGLAGYFLAL